MGVMNVTMQQKTKRKYWKWAVLLVLAIIAAIIVLNRAWIYDWFRGVTYRPTAEMVNIRDKLKLTGRGDFLFNATQPELNGADDFNANCRQDEGEVAVLGCYTAGNIYVYDIADAKLNGIRELTTAHELLHAVWARMGNAEKEDLKPILQQVYQNNLSVLKDDIETYADDERVEEIFVRAGTEIKKLPDVLEKYYAEIFNNQDAVVDFYEKYIAVFREIKMKMEGLASEIEVLRDSINVKMAEYENKVSQLEADIAGFNSCAETAGCFVTEAEFNVRRNALVVREGELNLLNDEINNMIDDYNLKVDEYNADALESRKLQNMINSKADIKEIK